jgi:hypothetical protein
MQSGISPCTFRRTVLPAHLEAQSKSAEKPARSRMRGDERVLCIHAISPHSQCCQILTCIIIHFRFIPLESNGRVIGEWWIRKDLEGSRHGFIEVLSRHLPREIEENHEKLQSGYPVSRPRFEQTTSGIWVQSVTTMPASFVKFVFRKWKNVKWHLLFSLLSLFWKKWVGLWDHDAVRVCVCVCVSPSY